MKIFLSENGLGWTEIPEWDRGWVADQDQLASEKVSSREWFPKSANGLKPCLSSVGIHIEHKVYDRRGLLMRYEVSGRPTSGTGLLEVWNRGRDRQLGQAVFAISLTDQADDALLVSDLQRFLDGLPNNRKGIDWIAFRSKGESSDHLSLAFAATVYEGLRGGRFALPD